VDWTQEETNLPMSTEIIVHFASGFLDTTFSFGGSDI
jgi:hypothetical protein